MKAMTGPCRSTVAKCWIALIVLWTLLDSSYSKILPAPSRNVNGDEILSTTSKDGHVGLTCSDTGGYRGVVVGFRNLHDQDKKKIDEIVENLKAVLREASTVLYNATRKSNYFAEIVLLLPKGLKVDNDQSSVRRKKFRKQTLHEAQTSRVATWEIFQYPSVILTSSNNEDEKTMWTQQPRGCGEAGDYIVVPIELLSTQNEKRRSLAQRFVHHWAKFRYGVFEESASSQGGHQECYFIPGIGRGQGSWKPTGCYQPSSKIDLRAEMDADTGLFQCANVPKKGDIRETTASRSSIMYFEGDDQVDMFCDGSEDYPHDWIAPTKHNILCDESSVWDVIKRSPDFKGITNGADPPESGPNFVNAREQGQRYMFVIQDRGIDDLNTPNMGDIFYTAVFRFVAYSLSQDTCVGFTGFGGALVNHESSTFACGPTRQTLLEQARSRVFTIKKNADSIDGLKRGLENAVQAISGEPDEVSTSIIVLMSGDVAFDLRDFTPLPMETLKSRAIPINFVLYPADEKSSSENVEAFAYATGGMVFSIPSSQSASIRMSTVSVALDSIHSNIRAKSDGIVEVHWSHHFSIGMNYGNFTIGGNCSGTDDRVFLSVFCDTVIMPEVCPVIRPMHADTEAHNVKLDPMEGSSMTSYSCIKSLDCPRDVPASWEYRFSITNDQRIRACSALATRKTEENHALFPSFQGRLSKALVHPTIDPLIIYGELKAGLRPITNAHIHASIVSLKTGQEVHVVPLMDNGSGDPDINANDGIYSAYFAAFDNTPRGRYLVSLTATKPSDDMEETTIEYFSMSAGSFYILEDTPTTHIGNLPPNRIADLKVVKINHMDRTALLRWTAPGNDYDEGQATTYEVRYSSLRERLSDDNFNRYGEMLETTCRMPKQSGSTEECHISLPSTEHTLYYVAVRAIDSEGNVGKVSNIIALYLTSTRPVTDTTLYKPEHQTTLYSDSTDSNGGDSKSVGSTPVTQDGSSSEQTKNDLTKTTDSIIDENQATPAVYSASFNKESFIILVVCVAVGILLLLIVINIIVCALWTKHNKKHKPQKKPSEKIWIQQEEQIGMCGSLRRFTGPGDDASQVSLGALDSLPSSTDRRTDELYSSTQHLANPSLAAESVLNRGQNPRVGSARGKVAGPGTDNKQKPGPMNYQVPFIRGGPSLNDFARTESQRKSTRRESNTAFSEFQQRQLSMSPASRRKCLAGQSPYSTSSLLHGVPKGVVSSNASSSDSHEERSSKVDSGKNNPAFQGEDAFFDLGVV